MDSKLPTLELQSKNNTVVSKSLDIQVSISDQNLPKSNYLSFVLPTGERIVDEKSYSFDVSALDEGEYASVIVWKSVDHFVEVLNRDIRLIDVLKPYVVAYDDGEYFHAFSGPTVDLSGYT